MFDDRLPYHPLINRHEEIRLARKMQAAQMAAHSFLCDRITLEEKEKIEYEGAIAREKMICANIRLVYVVAKKYQNCSLPMMDVVSEGFVGLIRAAEGYDSSPRVRFSTYATWWIKQSIKTALSNDLLISIPDYMNRSVPKWLCHKSLFVAKYGYDPTVEEMSEFMNISLRTAKQTHLASIAYQLKASGNEGIRQMEDQRTSDLISEDTELVRNAMQRFSDMTDKTTMRILKMRFGFTDKNGKGMTLKEIGKQTGLTRGRVRQIERKALSKLAVMV